MVVHNRGTLSAGSTAGALVIEGNLLNPGTLVVQVQDTLPNDDSSVVVRGDADLSDGTVRLRFNGYLPETGDRIQVLLVEGALSGLSSLQFEMNGLMPGFEFVSEVVGKSLEIEALNDAVSDIFFDDSFEG